MKILSYSLLASLVAIAGNSALAYAAQNDHAKEAMQHLEKAVESGNKGDAKSAGAQSEEAEKDIIQENREKPYTQPPKHITGENPRAEHDKATFDDIEKAKGYAKKGRAKDAADAAKEAEIHLQKKEQSK